MERERERRKKIEGGRERGRGTHRAFLQFMVSSERGEEGSGRGRGGGEERKSSAGFAIPKFLKISLFWASLAGEKKRGQEKASTKWKEMLVPERRKCIFLQLRFRIRCEFRWLSSPSPPFSWLGLMETISSLFAKVRKTRKEKGEGGGEQGGSREGGRLPTLLLFRPPREKRSRRIRRRENGGMGSKSCTFFLSASSFILAAAV